LLRDVPAVPATRPVAQETARLELVALRAAEVRALVEGDVDQAGRSAGVSFPSMWPTHADARAGLPWHLRALERNEVEASWRIRVIVERASRRVVGSINLKGPPDVDGDVEVGWGIDEPHRRRGYAVEAAEAVVAWALAQPRVHSLSATVPDDNEASRRVAERIGMVRTSQTRRELPLWRRGRAPQEVGRQGRGREP
jgi:RimJ/RimL family protein N-acetyltransferase